MANNPIGDTFWGGTVGVVNVEYNGVDLGKTTAATEIVYEEDILDIIYQQTGTRPDDKVRTGQAWMVNCTFGEIDNDLIADLMQGMTESGTGDSLKAGRSLYTSMKDTEGKELILKRVDSDGVSTTDPKYWITFFNAGVMITGMPSFDAGAQRNFTVQFYCFYDTSKSAFWIAGVESSF